MNTKLKIRKKNHGTSQEDRAFSALNFEYVKIDERSFEDLLIFTSGFTKLINYYNLSDKIEGDWSTFFNDETFVIASIMEVDAFLIETDFRKYLYKANLFNRQNKKITYYKRNFSEIHKMALLFQHWLQGSINSKSLLKQEIENIITTKLNITLEKYNSLVDFANISNEFDIAFNFLDFHPLWNLTKIKSNDEHIKKIPKEDVFSFISNELDVIFQSFYEMLLYFKIKAVNYMELALHENNHTPEVALFLSFLKLFKIAQSDVNSISKRHLEYYYAQVLKQKPLKGQHDQLYLSFKMYENVAFSDIKKGTPFIAGEDKEGNDVIYLTDEEIRVTQAEICKVKNIFIDHRKTNIDGVEINICSKILSIDIPIDALSGKVDSKIKSRMYAAFGESQTGKGLLEKTMEDAKIGFAISASVLFMKEGLREVSISLEFSTSSYQIFLKKVLEVSQHEKSKEEQLFPQLFGDAFIISITSESGWMTITNYIICKEDNDAIFKIEFDIDDDKPAIVAFDKEIHDGQFRPLLPVIKVNLNPNSYLYPYSLINPLELEEVVINTKVSNVKKLMLYNNFGQLNSDNPFFPFGTTPRVGYYFLIGSNEIFQKMLDNFIINIEWHELPEHNSGFVGHYKAYNLAIDNDSFEIRLSILDRGRWQPEYLEQQTIKLFYSNDNVFGKGQKSRLSDKSVLNTINTKKIKLPPNYNEIKEDLIYTNTSRRGFVKLELSNPTYSFCHDIYPSLLSDIIIKNSKITPFKIFKSTTQELPNPPYTPQIKTISLDYTSSAVISLRDRSRKVNVDDLRGEVYHIHPFGEQIVYPNTAKHSTKFLPEYIFEGAIIFGFKDLYPPQVISFLLEMYDKSSTSSEQEHTVVEWYYLINNEWHTLKPSAILKDDTNGFMKTGIIKLKVPEDINQNNTILDNSYFWIKAVVVKGIESASHIVSVHSQVVTAKLDKSTTEIGQYYKPLSAFSINRSVNNIEGVQTICQPIVSFNGRAEEAKEDFYIRIAENIHHKKRAVSSWDYERLILDKFPEIYKVTCLTNMNSQNLDAPGNVLIIVMPYNTNKSKEPLVSSDLLFQIKNFIKEIISPFVKLEVRNPSYEYIKIIFSVKFLDDYNHGYLKQKMNEEINGYLSNIVNLSSLTVGGKVSTADILSFIRTLSYVDFITTFSMIQTAKDFNGNYTLYDTAKENNFKTFLEASKPWSILIPVDDHQISVLKERIDKNPTEAGIDILELGQDFILE